MVRVARRPRPGLSAAVALSLLLASFVVALAGPQVAQPFAFSAAQHPLVVARRRPHNATTSRRTTSRRSKTSSKTSSETSTRTPTGSTATGCGSAQPAEAGAPGATAYETLRVGRVERGYWVHLPQAYLPNGRSPLVLAFHGRGTTAHLFEGFTQLSQLADAHDFIAVYPQGLMGSGGQAGWNTGRKQDPHSDDVGFVRALLPHLQATVCVDPARIYATGFSNGGGFVAVLACKMADRFAAFAPVAGDYYPQPGGCHPARPVSLLEIHGTADSINPYDGNTQLGYPPVSEWLQEWATRDDCVAQPVVGENDASVVEQRWEGCRDGGVIAHDRLIGIDHIWPLGDQSSGGADGSTANTPFDTDAAIWRLFAARTLAGARRK